jgi:hypothetical protein
LYFDSVSDVLKGWQPPEENSPKAQINFYSVSDDVLKKVVADPVLLELDVDRTENGFPAEKNVCIADMTLTKITL